MFTKPFRIKSKNQLKSTERKKLWEEISKIFPSLSEGDVQLLLPKAETISVLKIITHQGQLVRIYCAKQVPMFFYLEKPEPTLFPTVFTLWCHPNLLDSFTTVSNIVPQLTRGADLMLPGLVLEEPVTLHSFGKLPKGMPVYINTLDNKAAVAVGITALSSEDMYMAGGRGKCIQIFHIVNDTLYELGKSITRPEWGSVNMKENGEQDDNLENSNIENPLTDELEKLDIDTQEENLEEIVEKVNDDDDDDDERDDNETNTENVDLVKQMDDLLEYCFLKACKTTIKSTDLPMRASNFFKNHILPMCPADQNINIKKTRYKKLSVFLADMKEKGVINTSVTKGVETLLSVQFDHPLLKELVVEKESAPMAPAGSNTAATTVAECYRVTADVVPVLAKFGYKKGDVMKRAEIRKCFTEYVKAEDLQDGRILKLNPQLAGIFKTKASQETITMEDGINKFIGRMTHMHEVTLAGTKLLHTGKLAPIDMRVALRANGKKATLVNNLETFGINPKEFSKECQSIGASATIVDDPGKKTPSVLVQGNQIIHVYKLLTEKYQIRKNYIRGLEFAPKKK